MRVCCRHLAAASKYYPPPANLRPKFQYTHDLTQLFPRHMAKGMKQLEARLATVDCVLEVHDARIPFSGRVPQFTAFLSVRPHILVLNKTDLADLAYREQVDAQLREQGTHEVVYTSTLIQTHNHVLQTQLLPLITATIQRSERFNRREHDEFNVLVLGVPNVGKSSLINAMRHLKLKMPARPTRGRVAQVGALPGVTRSMSERIRISAAPDIFMLDSPGILQPRARDKLESMKLALVSSLQDSQVGELYIADFLLFWLNQHSFYSYVDHFGLPQPTDDVMELLAFIAKQRDLTTRVSGKSHMTSLSYVRRPNFYGAAHLLLSAFRKGQLGPVNLDVDLVASCEMQDADRQWSREHVHE